MPKPPIAAIINFCSNEWRFLSHAVKECSRFARQILIPVCDHFFDGTPENRTLLEAIYRSVPNCTFIEYPFIPSEIPRRVFSSIAPAHFWFSLSRLVGTAYLDRSVDTALFLDADEIPDGGRFLEWLHASDYQHHTVMKLANYWYFREPAYQALSWEDSVLLAHIKSLDPDLILRQEERDAIYNLLPGPKRRLVTGTDGEPMFHHFSWVRTKEEMIKKVTAWGHREDRNWVELVEKEFSTPFQGVDFVHGYKYKTVTPPFEICLESSKDWQPAVQKSTVFRMTQKELLKLLKFKKNLLSSWVSSLFST